MNDAALAVREFRFENRAFWRNPAAAFFTFAFPLMFLFLFPVIFGGGEINYFGTATSAVTFYVPAIGVFAIITATYTSNAMTLTFAREEGVLKRKRGTPLPAAAYMTGRLMHSMFLTLLLITITVAVGAVFHDVAVPTNTLPAFLVTILVGAAVFCALGIAITGFIPNVDAAPAVVNASMLPLMFISDVFIPIRDAPGWLTTVAQIFPIYHFSQAMLSAFNPFETGSGFEWDHLAVMGLWGVAGLTIAFRFFRWEAKA